MSRSSLSIGGRKLPTGNSDSWERALNQKKRGLYDPAFLFSKSYFS